MNKIYDLDFKNRRSWQGTLGLLFALCGESADLSFDLRVIGDKKLPTVEIRLDNPAELEEPTVTNQGGISVETWKYGTVIVADKKPEITSDRDIYLLRGNGAAAVTYHAFRETVRVLKSLSIPAEFSWSSLPLAPVCDDAAFTAKCEQDIYAYGAIHTVWLRCPDDEKVKTAMRSINRCGQFRVQNMTTANTWIAGSVVQEKLLKCDGRCI